MKYTTAGKLFNLDDDITETNYLSTALPEIKTAMSQQLTEIIQGNGIR